MLLHLGDDSVIATDDIIAILDAGLLNTAQNRLRALKIDGDVKSVVLRRTAQGVGMVYSPLSPRTLQKRVNTCTIL